MMDTFDDIHSFAFLQADEISNDSAVFVNNKDSNDNEDNSSSGSDSPSAAASSSDDDMAFTKDEPPSPASSSCETPMHHSGDSAQHTTQRSWRLTHLSGLLLANNANALKDISYFTDNINIEVRTRSDNSNPQVPERLYSSLKYEMRHSVMRDLLLDSTNLLMCKVEVVNPQDHHEEILKTNGQKLIKGIQEVTAMSKNASSSALECKMKIQFTDVSYHHEKKYFAFKVSFIDPLIHVSEPVLVLVSAPFQVFARRPTTRTKKEGSAAPQQPSTPVSIPAVAAPIVAKKAAAATLKQQAKATVAHVPAVKRAKEQPAQQQAPAAKKMKPAAIVAPPVMEQKEADSKIQLKKGASLNDFLQCLDLLIAFKNSLTHDDQKIALDVAQKRLLMSSTASNAKNQLGKAKQMHVTAEQDSINSFFSDL